MGVRKRVTTETNSMTLLPGQPIPIPRGPTLQLGPGTYSRDNQVRSSIMGVPHFQASVCVFFYLGIPVSVTRVLLRRQSLCPGLALMRRLLGPWCSAQ